MQYTRVTINAFGYELPPNVVTTEDLEEQLVPLYETLHFQPGQLAALTGIQERRFWDPGYRVSDGALAAGRKALRNSTVAPGDIGILIYGAVCRNYIEPATACAVSHGLGLPPAAQVYDISNACLGVLNGIVQIANAIELGQVKAGMVVACETSREVIEATIRQLNRTRDIGRAFRVVRSFDTGMISVNSSSSVHIEAPFGGVKGSGIGREQGMVALEHYSELKTVFVAEE